MDKTQREAKRARLEALLSSQPLTEGMYVRARGDDLILGRNESFGAGGELVADDRLKLTALNRSTFGLSVRRHTGRWEKTPFTGTLDELTEIIWSMMQHIVAPYS